MKTLSKIIAGCIAGALVFFISLLIIYAIAYIYENYSILWAFAFLCVSVGSTASLFMYDYEGCEKDDDDTEYIEKQAVIDLLLSRRETQGGYILSLSPTVIDEIKEMKGIKI